MQATDDQRKTRFGPFEVDRAAGELRKAGHVIRIQEQPFQVLVALIERPGEVVSRDELRERLWPGDAFGEFDQGLNTAINKLREALGDSAANPRFVETLPKRGYRFVHPVDVEPEPPLSPPPESSVRPQAEPGRKWVYLAGALGLLLISGVVWMFKAPKVQSGPFARFVLRFNPPVSLTPDKRLTAISPDGRRVAIVDSVRVMIGIQDFDQPQARILEATEGATTVFWSPDSKVVGFVAVTGQLLTVPAAGGPKTLVCDWPEYVSSASWSPDGKNIVFASGTPSSLYTVPAHGGPPKVLVAAAQAPRGPKKEGTTGARGWLSNPQFLPGSTKLLFENQGVLAIRDMGTDVEHVIGPGRNAAYSPTGHLLYRSGTDLWARRFSIEKAELSGDPFMVARNATDPSVSADGTLVYRDVVTSNLVWRDRAGKSLGTIAQEADSIFYPALSPDGRRVAIEAVEGETIDIWVLDVERGTRIRLTSDPGTEIVPAWSPDGEQIAYGSYRAGNIDLYSRVSDARRDEVALLTNPINERLSDWSSDRQYILYSIHPKNKSDIWYLKRSEGGRWESYPLLETPAFESSARFSLDGRYVAYLSDESGRIELYVREFAAGGRKWPVSAKGASQVRWSRNGKELFYSEGGTLVAVPVSFVGGFAAGKPVQLFANAAFSSVVDPNYDVSADGQRIILPEPVGRQERFIHVLQHWSARYPQAP